MHYVAVIDKDPDSAYGIQFPEVPRCFSAADTFEEIVPNAIEALSLFFEDSEPVSARGLEAVREQVAENIAQGAVLMMIPYVHDRKRVVRVNLSLEKGFLDTMDEAARKKFGTYRYLQIAENRCEGKRVKQTIIATPGSAR